MGRRVSVTYIRDDAIRKVCFKKRWASLTKKVMELSILCAVETCLILFNPFTSRTKVVQYPEDATIIDRFNNLSLEEQTQRMVDQKQQVESQVKKVRKNVDKIKIRTEKEWMKLVMLELINGKITQENLMIANSQDFKLFLDMYQKDVKKQIESLKSDRNLVKAKVGEASTSGTKYFAIEAAQAKVGGAQEYQGNVGKGHIVQSAIPSVQQEMSRDGDLDWIYNMFLSPVIPNFHFNDCYGLQ